MYTLIHGKLCYDAYGNALGNGSASLLVYDDHGHIRYVSLENPKQGRVPLVTLVFIRNPT